MIFVKIFKRVKMSAEQMHEVAVDEYERLTKKSPKLTYVDKKPILDDGFVSASHSGEYSVIAYSDKEVGVDIERIRDISFARYFMGEIGKPYRSIEDFYTEWTFREARFKAYGVSVNRATGKDVGLHPRFLDGYDMCVVGEGDVLFSWCE